MPLINLRFIKSSNCSKFNISLRPSNEFFILICYLILTPCIYTKNHIGQTFLRSVCDISMISLGHAFGFSFAQVIHRIPAMLIPDSRWPQDSSCQSPPSSGTIKSTLSSLLGRFAIFFGSENCRRPANYSVSHSYLYQKTTWLKIVIFKIFC